MGEHLLSVLHIQKLGNPIEEIRQRALASVISKYNLNLVDESNIENTKLLLDKLLNWFDYEKFTDEKKVLTLMLRILKYENSDMILREIDRKNFLQKLKNIEKKLSCEFRFLLEDIIKRVASIEDTDDCFSIALPETDRSSSVDIYGFYTDLRTPHPSETIANDKTIEERPIFKVEYFPWQHLTCGDKHVLSSVYDGLRYIDKKHLILQSCQFFIEVLLRDFPVEIFIQRPVIVKIFLQLIECTDQDVRIPVVKCLIKIVERLKRTIQDTLNPSLFNLKKEYYSTSISIDFLNKSENQENFGVLFDDEPRYEENDCIDSNLKNYQLSVPQFCFETLFKILPFLGKKSAVEEINVLLSLTCETLCCLLFNLNTEIWSQKHIIRDFYKIFVLLRDNLKCFKDKNRIVYVMHLYFVVKIIKCLKPSNGIQLSEVLAPDLRSELSSSISDFVLVLLFPQLHSEIVKHVKQLPGEKEKEAVQDHKDVTGIIESMRSAVTFVKSNGKFKSKLEKLQCVRDGFQSLDFHQNPAFVQAFVHGCLLRWRKSQLKEDELKLREKILIRFLAHSNDFVKVLIYREINSHAMKLLGVDEAKAPSFEFPGDRLEFLFSRDVLTEIICHGLTSPLAEVRQHSSEIISNLLKSKYIMSDICWNEFMIALIPCLSLLQCFGDKANSLGRCIVKMFDPDIAKSTGLPPLEILKGNMRFLFSKNNLTREEALSRLFWLLSKEDYANKKLPRMSVLTQLNLSGICSCVKPKEYTKTRHSFYSPSRLCDVLEMLGSDDVEPNIRRSALSQISVMMDDVHLHSTFLEQRGLEKVVQILNNCLIEKEYRNYPDSVKPIIDILRAVAYQNVSVRQELSCQIEVMFNVLRGLFLFSSDESLRQNAVELICLLLYNDCILRVPSAVPDCVTISLPEIVVSQMCLPFTTHVHWKNSKHLEPSLKKSYMSKKNFSRVIRVSWAIQLVGSLNELIAIQTSELGQKFFYPELPDDMKISTEDIECLRNCAFSLSVKQTLYNIQNATTHEAVFSSLHKLHSYFLLYKVDKATNGKKISDFGSDTTLSHMLWESTFERFMTSQPSCNLDEILLLQVVRLIQLLLKCFKSERLIDWIGKLLVDENQPLIKLMKSIGNENFGLMGKELRLALIELTQQTVTLKTSLDKNKWFSYLELISRHLKLDKKNEFYNVAYVDWFLSLMVDLTGNRNWDFSEKTEYLEKLIIRLMEIIIAFHCTKDSAISFMGINIVKNALLVLNHVMASSQVSVKEWEKLWFQSLSKVIGHERGANYCWILSLWFTRDVVTRASAYNLFVSFSITSQSCDLLIDQLHIQFDHVWTQAFKALFDGNECGFVREKAALLLKNLTGQGTKTSCGSFLQHLKKIDFYSEINKILSNYSSETKLSEVVLHENLNCFSGAVVTTPSFVTSIAVLLLSIMSLNPTEVSEELLECDVIRSLLSVLEEVPESTNICEKHLECTDVLQMYKTVCRLLTRSVRTSCSVHSFILRSQQFFNYTFSMINYVLYCGESKLITAYRNELWSEVLDLFSVLLADNSKCTKDLNKQTTAFVNLNKCMSDNGIDHFISSLYIAMTSNDLGLRSSVFGFFVNLFRHELNTPEHVSISDVLERKIPVEVLETIGKCGWKALKVSEDPAQGFGVRTADVLTQIFLLSSNCNVRGFKTSIAECLSSLLGVCKSAQDFCIERGFPDSILSVLKQICVKLNLQTVDSLKKSSSRKKIDPLLSEAETLFKLICNLVIGNEKAKWAVADCALSSVVHKLWTWCMAKRSLHIVAVKMLCTFSYNCDQACRSLALSGSLTMIGLKKSSGSQTLLNAVTNQIGLEMDLISNSHDSQLLRLCLQLLTNSCKVTECRSLISKGNFLQTFVKLHPNRRKKNLGDEIAVFWLKFFIAFSSYPDGQLILSKNQDLLDLFILKSSSSKSVQRLHALEILRNICFHPLNRVRMLSSCSFLSLLFDTLESKKAEDVQAVVVAIWALTANSQKAKLVVRSSGIEGKLVNTRRRCVVAEDTETADLIQVVIDILKNK